MSAGRPPGDAPALAPPGRVALSPAAFAVSCSTIVLTGGLAAVYGPLLEQFTRRFGVGLDTVGVVLSAHFAGSLIGVVAALVLIERIPGHLAVRGALGLLALGCVGAATAPSWPLMLAAVLLLGIGFGGLDLGLNQVVAHSANPRSPALLNVLNAMYGIGAVLGPLVVAAVGGGASTAVYAGAAVLATVLAAVLRGMSGRLRAAPAGAGPARPRRAGALLATFIVAYVLYLGAETGVGGWMATHLQQVGYGTGAAATLTAAFWAAMALGRLGIAPVTGRVGEPAIVLTAVGASIATLLLTLAPPAAPVGYVLTGLALAPIFPTGLAWLVRLDPGNPRTTSWLFAVTMLGGVLFPPVVGAVIARFGAAWAPALLAALAAGSLAAFAAAARRRHP